MRSSSVETLYRTLLTWVVFWRSKFPQIISKSALKKVSLTTKAPLSFLKMSKDQAFDQTEILRVSKSFAPARRANFNRQFVTTIRLYIVYRVWTIEFVLMPCYEVNDVRADLGCCNLRFGSVYSVFCFVFSLGFTNSFSRFHWSPKNSSVHFFFISSTSLNSKFGWL